MRSAEQAKASASSSLDDRASARIAWKAARGIAIPDDQVNRLDYVWQEADLLAGQDGVPGLDEWLGRVKVTYPERVESIEAAVAEAKLEPEETTEEENSEPRNDAQGRPIDFGIIGSRVFATTAYKLSFLIRGFLVEHQPCVIGGPRKALKTTLLVEMVVCLAAGLRFLGQFDIPQRRKVLFLSGESGQATLQETARRICAARGVALEDLDGQLFWGFALPKLGDPAHIDALAGFIESNGIEVVVVDPLYLCLLSGGTPGVKRLDPANLFDVGPLLARITETILGAGATPILAHHLRKNRDNPESPPELEDLAFAGIQEFARQWILIGRRTPYEPGTGEHKLWLSVGGSAGHSGAWALDVSEGVVDGDFNGRKWETGLAPATQARQEAQEQAATKKADRKADFDRVKQEAAQRRRDEDAKFALDRLRAMTDAKGQLGYATGTSWRDSMSWNSGRFGPVKEHLLAVEQILPTEVAVPVGKSYRICPGFCVASQSTHTGTNPDDTRTASESPGSPPGPEQTRTIGGFPPPKGGGTPGVRVCSSGFPGGSGGYPDEDTRTPGESPGKEEDQNPILGQGLSSDGAGNVNVNPEDVRWV